MIDIRTFRLLCWLLDIPREHVDAAIARAIAEGLQEATAGLVADDEQGLAVERADAFLEYAWGRREVSA